MAERKSESSIGFLSGGETVGSEKWDPAASLARTRRSCERNHGQISEVGRERYHWSEQSTLNTHTYTRLYHHIIIYTQIYISQKYIKHFIYLFKVIWEGWERDFVLQVILAGAFYPNYFVKRPQNIQVHKDSVVRNLSGLDPMRTVFLRGWPTKQPGYLYAQKLQKIFSKHLGVAENRIMISFDKSKRIYIQFRENEIAPSDKSLYKISDFVYKAIKMRQSEILIEIGLLNVMEAHERSKNQDLNRFERISFFHKGQISKRNSNPSKVKPKLPGLDVTFIPLSIQNVSFFFFYFSRYFT